MNIIFADFLKGHILSLTHRFCKGPWAKPVRHVSWLIFGKRKIRHESQRRTSYCRNIANWIQMWPFSKGLFSDLVEMVLYDPSRNTEKGVYNICKFIGGETSRCNESKTVGSIKHKNLASPLSVLDL